MDLDLPDLCANRPYFYDAVGENPLLSQQNLLAFESRLKFSHSSSGGQMRALENY